ncbi:hypothetical protein [Arhodomonas sp. KWT]|uniref:hypothetical protein n=1 Tax=Arhodomonas sp. KWT TaxID=2679915 RepID=UPI0013D196FB|nr:hypothetical protein [Arhodomonas sp. KWT]
MLHLTFVFISAFGAAYALLFLTDGAAMPVFEQTLSVFVTVAILFGAMSFALYNYVDGIQKDFPKELKSRKPTEFAEAVATIDRLKGEVISNVALIICLLVGERIILGVETVLANQGWNAGPLWVWLFPSTRAACLLVSIYAALVQFRGFFIANDMRSVLLRNGD